jgi:hypothetical protein
MAPAVAAAQTPSAADVLAKAQAAVGGRAAFEAHQSMLMVGSFSIPAMGIEGVLEVSRMRPNLSRQKITLGGMGEVDQGTDGTLAWAIQPGQGAMLLSGEQAEAVKREADWFQGVQGVDAYKSVEVVGAEAFEGQQAWKVKFAPKEGAEYIRFFAQDTGLPIGGTTTSPMGDITVVFGEYKEYGGLKLATKITQKTGMGDFQIAITDVKLDAVDKSAFEPPAEIKAQAGRP